MLTGSASPDVHPEDTSCEMGRTFQIEAFAIQTANHLQCSIFHYTTALHENFKTKGKHVIMDMLIKE